MDLTTLSMKSDTFILDYLEDNRPAAPYNCLWCVKEHKGSVHTKFDRYKNHILKCRFRAFHTVQEKKLMKPAMYPICPDPADFKYYRGTLASMNSCYEYHYDRLGVQGFQDTPLFKFIDKFVARHCKAGDEDYHQSISLCMHPPGTPPPQEPYKQIFHLNTRTWRVKKRADEAAVFMNDVELFHFLLDEYKPLFNYALGDIVKTDSHDFWHMLIKGKRTNGNQARREHDIKCGYVPGGFMGMPFTRFPDPPKV